jgi:ubiquitin-protein ligase E3 A
LTEGCGNQNCTNSNCASNSYFKRLTRDEAAALSIRLARKKEKLCIEINTNQSESTQKMDIDDNYRSIENNNQQEQKEPKSLNDQLQEAVRFVSQITQDSSTNVHPKGSYLTEEKLKILIDKCKTTNNFKPLIETLEKGYQDLSLLSISFQKTTDNTKETLFNIDFESIRRTYAMLNSLSIADDLAKSLNNAITTICNVIKLTLSYKKDISDHEMNEILHSLLIINELPLLDDPAYMDLSAKYFYSTISELPDSANAKLVRLWSKWSVDDLRSFLNRVQQYITLCVISRNLDENSDESSGDDSNNETSALHKNIGVTGAVNVVRLIYYASILGGCFDDPKIIAKEREIEENESKDYYQPTDNDNPLNTTNHKLDPLEDLLNIHPIDCRKPKLESNEFINEVVNDAVDIQHDYVEYKQLQQYTNVFSAIGARHQKNFSFLAHPYVLTLSKKNLGLYFDNKIRMIRERRQNIMQSLFEGLAPNPYFKIRLNRNNVLYEALSLIELQEEEDASSLRKQLFIEFENEQGVDEGGVTKEFFQLAIDELMNKGYSKV